MEKGMGYEFMVMLITVLMFISSIVISFFINWRLSIIMICLIPIIIVVWLMFTKVMMGGVNLYQRETS